MQKNILINWTFHPDLRTDWNVPNTIWTCTDAQYQLFAINEKKDEKTEKEGGKPKTEDEKTEIYLRQLKVAIEACPSEGELLVLLHKNPPHNMNLRDIEHLYNSIKRTGKFTIQLFGGGTEALYFGPKSELGVLGDRDKGLFATSYEIKEPTYKKVRSTFMVDRDSRWVNAEHLAYIWRNYWESPKKAVYRLMEDFRLHTDGFDFDADNPSVYLTHLESNHTLWHALHVFAGQPKNGASTQAFQYALTTLQGNIRTHPDHGNLLEQLQQLRKTVGDTLNNDSIINYPNHVREIYTGMFDLFKRIPVNL